MTATTHQPEQVRQLLRNRRADLIGRRLSIGSDLQRANEPLVADAEDRAIQQENDEPLAAIGSAASSEIAAIDEALTRIDHNLYGVCKVCGKSISDDRLRVVPHATTCVACFGE